MLSPVRVTVRTGHADLHSRTYVPGSECAMSQQEYNEFALGNLIALVVGESTNYLDLGEREGISVGDVGLTHKSGEHEAIGFGEGWDNVMVTGWAVELVKED